MRPVLAAFGGGQQLARPQEVQLVDQQPHLMVRHPVHDVRRGDVVGVLQARGLHQFLQRFQRVVVEAVDPLGLVGHHQRLLAHRVLRGHAGGAQAGVAGLGLHAAQREHEAARRIAPVGAQRHHPRDVEGADHLAGATQLDVLTQVQPHQRVVHQQQALLQRRTHVVGELQRRGPGAALGPVHHDEVGRDAGGQHRLADGEPLPRVTDAQLEAGGLAARQRAQPVDEAQHFHRRVEGTMARWADARHPHRHATRRGDFRRHLGAGQHAAMARLGALAELELDHLDLRVGGVGDEAFFVERTVVVAAAEVARADLPDQVAAMLAVVAADGAFAGVVREMAALGAAVERQDGIGRQRAEAHRRDVEHAGAVGLRAAGADGHAEVVAVDLRGRDRVVDPLVAHLLDVHLRAEGPVVRLTLGALVHQRALLSREGCGLVVALDEVLADLGADEFQQEAQVPDDGVVAQDGVLRLPQVVQADQHTGPAQQRHPAAAAGGHPGQRAEQGGHGTGEEGGVAHRGMAVDRGDPGWGHRSLVQG